MISLEKIDWNGTSQRFEDSIKEYLELDFEIISFSKKEAILAFKTPTDGVDILRLNDLPAEGIDETSILLSNDQLEAFFAFFK